MKNIILANKELNEWCGTKGINYYEGIEALGFLFKYAVPLLEGKLGYKEAYKLLIKWITEVIEGKDPAGSLFRAIFKCLGGE